MRVLSAVLSSWLLLSAGSAGEVQPTSRYRPRQYTIDVSPDLIEQARSKAHSFRTSSSITQPEWTDGPPTVEVNAIAKYWANEYDWSAEQAYLNDNFSHYITTVPPPDKTYNRSVDVHFIHQQSRRSNAVPLLMLHGWPSTSTEWLKVIPDLVAPKRSTDPAFHVVAPDLPGYGFSPAPSAPGLGPSALSSVFASLMQQLGYQRYAVYSTDAGWVVGVTMATEQEQHIINHLTDFYVVIPNATDIKRYAANQTTVEETRYIESINAFMTKHSGYASISSTYPLSLAYALNDSPVGFLAWIYQLVYTDTDQVQTAAELITRTLLLWIPGAYANVRSYKELYPFIVSGHLPVSRIPTSVLQFGFGNDSLGYAEVKNFNYVPRDWIERTANVTYFNRHPKGAHFPAETEPELVLDDIRAIFKG